MAVHLLNCSSCPVDVKVAIYQGSKSKSVQEMGNMLGIADVAHAGGEDNLARLETAQQLEKKKKPKVQPGASSFVAICDDQQAEIINMSIMQFLAGCGIAMLVVESTFFISMLRALNPAYVKHHLIKAKTFTQTWLPKLRQSIEDKISSCWATSKIAYVTLGSDGFKGENGRKVHIITQSKGRKFVMFDDCIKET